MSNQLQLAKNFALALFFDASPVSNYFDIQFDRTEDERRENVCVFQRGQKSENERCSYLRLIVRIGIR